MTFPDGGWYLGEFIPTASPTVWGWRLDPTEAYAMKEHSTMVGRFGVVASSINEAPANRNLCTEHDGVWKIYLAAIEEDGHMYKRKIID
jgi:hypothetical protein